MLLFQQLATKIEPRLWLNNPELGLFDIILEMHPEFLDYVKDDITRGQKSSNFGRGDMPSVDQILRAAIYKEVKNLGYRELADAQGDSRSCEEFIKLDPNRFFLFSLVIMGKPLKYLTKV